MNNRRNFETLANLAVTTSHFAHGPVTMPYYGKKLKEEVRELLAEINREPDVNLARIDDELGDVLMVLVKICKFYNSEPYDLLFKATNKAFMRIANPDWGREKKTESNANTCNVSEDYPGKAYQPLFDYMSAEHGVMLMEGDIHEIINIVLSIQSNGQSTFTRVNDGENIPETFKLLQSIKDNPSEDFKAPGLDQLFKFGYAVVIGKKVRITPKGEEAIKTFESTQLGEPGYKMADLYQSVNDYADNQIKNPATAGSKILPLWYPLLKQFGSGQSENLKADSEYLSILLEMGHIAGNEAGGFYITPSGCTALDFLDRLAQKSGPDWEPLSKTGIFGGFNPAKALESFKNAMEDLIKQYPGLRAKMAEPQESKTAMYHRKGGQDLKEGVRYYEEDTVKQMAVSFAGWLKTNRPPGYSDDNNLYTKWLNIADFDAIIFINPEEEPRQINGLSDINTDLIEGRFLMAAISRLMVLVDTKKQPDEVVNLLDDLQKQMYEGKENVNAGQNADFLSDLYTPVNSENLKRLGVIIARHRRNYEAGNDPGKYMLGFANGLIFTAALLFGNTPNYIAGLDPDNENTHAIKAAPVSDLAGEKKPHIPFYYGILFDINRAGSKGLEVDPGAARVRMMIEKELIFIRHSDNNKHTAVILSKGIEEIKRIEHEHNITTGAEKQLFTVSVGTPEYAILKYLEGKHPTSAQVQYDAITEILKDNHCITHGIIQDDNTVFATLTVAGICVIAEAEERSKAPEKPANVKKPQPGGNILKRPKHDTHELNSVGQISEDGPLGRLFIMAVDKLKATCYRSYTDDEVLKVLNESTGQRYK